VSLLRRLVRVAVMLVNPTINQMEGSFDFEFELYLHFPYHEDLLSTILIVHASAQLIHERAFLAFRLLGDLPKHLKKLHVAISFSGDRI
jgi:hypothetical protein